MNEPCMWLHATEYAEYIRNTGIEIANYRLDLPIVAGNQEYNLAARQGDIYN